MVELRCVTLREYPPKGLRGSRVSVMVTEMLMGPESSRLCGDCVEDLACPLVTVLSGVVVSFSRCFKVSFSDIQKSKSLNLSRKVFQSFKQTGRFGGREGAAGSRPLHSNHRAHRAAQTPPGLPQPHKALWGLRWFNPSSPELERTLGLFSPQGVSSFCPAFPCAEGSCPN